MSSDTQPQAQPQRVEKPWGYELWWAETPHYAGKILHVDAGHRLSLQMHREKDESSYLLSGRLRLTRGPSAEELTTEEIGPGFTWRVEPGTVHTIEALEDSDVLEVSTRTSTTWCACRTDTGARTEPRDQPLRSARSRPFTASSSGLPPRAQKPPWTGSSARSKCGIVSDVGYLKQELLETFVGGRVDALRIGAASRRGRRSLGGRARPRMRGRCRRGAGCSGR